MNADKSRSNDIRQLQMINGPRHARKTTLERDKHRSGFEKPELSFRKAARADVQDIVRLLADDPLASKRERYELPLPGSYLDAFEAIESDPNNELVVACLGDRIVGVLQLTFIPYLTYQGSWRALIEGVRVDSGVRSVGIGKALIECAIDRARERGCRLVQLTTDKTRPDALRFYEALGFVASHEGMKLHFKDR